MPLAGHEGVRAARLCEALDARRPGRCSQGRTSSIPERNRR
jgi:hypothetical protein